MDDEGWKTMEPYLKENPISYPIVAGNFDMAGAPTGSGAAGDRADRPQRQGCRNACRHRREGAFERELNSSSPKRDKRARGSDGPALGLAARSVLLVFAPRQAVLRRMPLWAPMGLFQLLGAVFAGFRRNDWIARGAVLGGIRMVAPSWLAT